MKTFVYISFELPVLLFCCCAVVNIKQFYLNQSFKPGYTWIVLA